MYNVKDFTAIIKPPQASILAIGGTRFALSTDNILQKVMTVTLSCDGRIVDYEQAGKFLEAFKKNVENPANAGLWTTSVKSGDITGLSETILLLTCGYWRVFERFWLDDHA